jgi:hypothetical protein
MVGPLRVEFPVNSLFLNEGLQIWAEFFDFQAAIAEFLVNGGIPAGATSI